jgi:hypothetical protein
MHHEREKYRSMGKIKSRDKRQEVFSLRTGPNTRKYYHKFGSPTSWWEDK